MVLLATAFAFVVFWFVAFRYDDPLYFRLGLVALLGHIFVSVFVVPAVPYGWDIGQFDAAGRQLVSGSFPSGSNTVATFATIQGLVYVLFGEDPTNVAIVSGLFAVLTVIPIRSIATRLYGSVHLDGLTALVLFLPLPFLFTSLPMRDATSVFLFFAVLAILVITIEDAQYLLWLPIFPLWGILYLLRPELGAVVVLAAAAGVAVATVERYDLDVSLGGAVAFLGGLGLFGLILFSRLFPLARANAELAYRAQGGAVYLRGMQYASWFDLALVAPGRALYFLFAPFPLHVRSPFHAMALFSTVYIVVFVVAAVRSLRQRRFDQVVATILGIAFLAGLAGYGVINSNFGTNVRHRVTFVFVLLVFATPVIERWELAVRQWLGESPDQYEDHEEEHEETEEFDRHVHT